MKKNFAKSMALLLLAGTAYVGSAKAKEAENTESAPSACKGSGVICKVSGPWIGGLPSTWDSEKDKDGAAIVYTF